MVLGCPKCPIEDSHNIKKGDVTLFLIAESTPILSVLTHDEKGLLLSGVADDLSDFFARLYSACGTVDMSDFFGLHYFELRQLLESLEADYPYAEEVSI